ncbi:MAG: hypothetical protein EXR72_05530 [Myxococcales bacterium]|nr:hypothetical protein [Myxococcales bacterium]
MSPTDQPPADPPVSVPAATPPPRPARPSLKARLDGLIRAYGPVAFAVYFGLFAVTFAGFAAAIKFGVSVQSASSGAGTLLAAWVATKLTQPLRILATLALTPLAVRLFGRRREGTA